MPRHVLSRRTVVLQKNAEDCHAHRRVHTAHGRVLRGELRAGRTRVHAPLDFARLDGDVDGTFGQVGALGALQDKLTSPAVFFEHNPVGAHRRPQHSARRTLSPQVLEPSRAGDGRECARPLGRRTVSLPDQGRGARIRLQLFHRLEAPARDPVLPRHNACDGVTASLNAGQTVLVLVSDSRVLTFAQTHPYQTTSK